MKPILISIIVVLFILMGVADALKDNQRKTVSKWTESVYLFILFFAFYYSNTHFVVMKISFFHYFLALCMIRQTVVNVSYGIVKKGIKWWYVGSTSVLSDGGLNWLITKALKTPKAHFLFWYYSLELSIGISVMYRYALIL